MMGLVPVFVRWALLAAAAGLLAGCVFARKGPEGYRWVRYRMNDRAPADINPPAREALSGETPRRFMPHIWERSKSIPLMKKDFLTLQNVRCAHLLYGDEGMALGIVMDGQVLRGISLSSSGKGFNEAEDRMLLENPPVSE